jgi:phage terminase large subunit GpA-like protein
MDKLDLLSSKMGRSMKSPTRLTVSEWADRERVLSPESCAEPGKWHTARAEYQRGVMDALSDPRVETVIVMSASQIGKTEIINNIVGYFIDQEPSPMLLVQPTLEMGQSWSKDRFAPMLRDTPCLKGRVKDIRSKDSNNTIMHKVFPGGHITISGANSAASLAARPIRVVLCDEVDRYPGSAGTEGDPVNLAFKRATTFWNRKRIVTSTPTIRGMSRIEKFWEASDKRRFFVPCPHCGELQALWWKNVKWEKDAKGELKFAVYVCEYCGKHITDADKSLMLRQGGWRSEAPFTGTAGFHLSELYSPWVTFEQTVSSFLKDKKDPWTLQVWVNTALGETWEEGADEGVDDKTLISRCEEYPKVVIDGRQITALPEGIILLTAGIDVQDDRLEIEVIGWGLGEESWSVDYKILYGDPAGADLWQRLDDMLMGKYRHVSGIMIGITAACIDTGGHHTQQVYSFVKPRQERRIWAIKGINQPGRPIIGRPSLNNAMHVSLYPLGVDTAKELVFTRLKISAFGYGYMHFPTGRNIEFFRQLTAEKPVNKLVRGREVRVWVKKRTRNEALDCRIYGIASLGILNPVMEVLADKMEEMVESAGENEMEKLQGKPRQADTHKFRRNRTYVWEW